MAVTNAMAAPLTIEKGGFLQPLFNPYAFVGANHREADKVFGKQRKILNTVKARV